MLLPRPLNLSLTCYLAHSPLLKDTLMTPISISFVLPATMHQHRANINFTHGSCLISECGDQEWRSCFILFNEVSLETRTVHGVQTVLSNSDSFASGINESQMNCIYQNMHSRLKRGQRRPKVLSNPSQDELDFSAPSPFLSFQH